MLTKSKKNLLVCLTPLQIVIAEKIIDLNPGKYDLFCIFFSKNNKADYYFDRLSKKCCIQFVYYINSTNKITKLIYFFRFKFFLNQVKTNSYENIYVASIENNFVHLLMSTVVFKNLISYDDGSANINKKSVYFYPKENHFIFLCFLKILGNRFDLFKVKDNICKHYTIYKGVDNIVENVEYIPLFQQSEIFNKKNEEISIFLGQPFSEIHLMRSIDISSVLEKFNINYYFPHPREKNKYLRFNYIETQYIFEDYVLGLLYEGYNVSIYTFLSTAALNVSGLNNIKIYVFETSKLKSCYSQLYSIYESLNCTLLDVDEYSR